MSLILPNSTTKGQPPKFGLWDYLAPHATRFIEKLDRRPTGESLAARADRHISSKGALSQAIVGSGLVSHYGTPGAGFKRLLGYNLLRRSYNTAANQDTTMPYGRYSRYTPRRSSVPRRSRTYRRPRRTVRRRKSTSYKTRRNVSTRMASSGMGRAQVSAISRMPIFKGNVFAPQLVSRLTNSLTFRHTTAAVAWPGVNICLEAVLNSALGPFILPVDVQQPLYFDQLKAIYKTTVVLHTLVSVQFIEYNSAKSLELVTMIALGNSAITPTIPTAQMSPQKTYMVMSNAQNQRTNFVNYKRAVDMSEFFGMDVTTEARFDETGTKIGNTTTEACNLQVWMRNLDQAALAAGLFLEMRLTVQQYILFKNRINVGAS